MWDRPPGLSLEASLWAMVAQRGSAASTQPSAVSPTSAPPRIFALVARGYGHAVLCARDFVGQDPFLHVVGDHLYISRTSCNLSEHDFRYNHREGSGADRDAAINETGGKRRMCLNSRGSRKEQEPF
jgi:hypothetical protein